jgi:antitoxin component of RelBE/YafQ-DinJ toxin-antitoxin module
VPDDADLVIDTTRLDIADAVDLVLEHLAAEGWLDRPTATPA